ncbi:hypothetical protein B0H19DRAFT_1187828, partial [Mycena capillaripes]
MHQRPPPSSAGLYRRPPRILALWCTMPISVSILLSNPPANHDHPRFCWCSSKPSCSSPWCVLSWARLQVRSPCAARDAAALHHDRHSINDFGAVRLCSWSCVPPTPHLSPLPSWDTPPDSLYSPRAASDAQIAAGAHQYALGSGSGAETRVIRAAAARSAFSSSFRFVSFPFLAWKMACINSAVRYCATSVDSGTLLSHSTARTPSSEHPGSLSFPSPLLLQMGSGGIGLHQLACAYYADLLCPHAHASLRNSLSETRQSLTYFALSRPTFWD